MQESATPPPPPAHTTVASAARIGVVRVACALGFLSAFVLTDRLWFSDRDFPLVPLHSWLVPFPPPYDWIPFLLLVAALASTVFAPSRRCAALVVVVLPVLIAQDQNRVQPWVVHVWVFYLIFWRLWSPPAPSSTEPEREAREIYPLLLHGSIIALYFWSGAAKFTDGFSADVLPYMLEPLRRVVALPEQLPTWVGPLVASIECGLGVGLAWSLTRTAAVVGVVLMHLMILLAIGPTGHNENSSVWPWNVAMMVLVPALFWKQKLQLRSVARQWRDPLVLSIGVVMVGVPAYGILTNGLDAYLSFGMYSGRSAKSLIVIQPEVIHRLPQGLGDVARLLVDDGAMLYEATISDWSLHELNSPPNAEPRVFRAIFEHLCGYELPPEALTMAIEPPRVESWGARARGVGEAEYFQCKDGLLEQVQVDSETEVLTLPDEVK